MGEEEQLKQKLLDSFISEEREKTRAGSGDDMYFEQQIVDYVKQQRPFWITFMDFCFEKAREGYIPIKQHEDIVVQCVKLDFHREMMELKSKEIELLKTQLGKV